jgi:hypothetical protein
MAGVFDDALDRRFTQQPELSLANIDGVDVLLIHNAADGLIYRLPASTLASFINAAVSQADILSALNAPNGVATLDSGGKVPAAQLPAYVDDVLEYASTAAFPATGDAGKIYVALDTNKTYRWSGSGYVEISASLALGETSSTAYRGDRGKTAYDHSQASGNPHGTSKADVGLGNVDNTSDASKPVSTAQQTALNAKADNTNPSLYGNLKQVLNNDIWYRKLFAVSPTTWQTIVVFEATGSTQYGSGQIEVWAQGYKNGAGNGGAIFSRWYYSIVGGSISVSVVGSDVPSGTFPPQVRLAVSGSQIQVQVAGHSDGSQFLSVGVNAFLNRGLIGGITWSITD